MTFDLTFDNVSKVYRVPHEMGGQTLTQRLLRTLRLQRRPAEDFWAVRNVSFQVERGEALGIIGHNGAGKSTILKLLSNITSPTSGQIQINGRLSALIEVGSGFHPELTGRENVFLSGSILGMTRREIATKIDSIFRFAEVEQFADTPVKRYSSGMYVRLGFSIAAHLDPEILLLDEVLAVGDSSFQAKCVARIEELKRDGRTIVFVSHDLSAVGRLCDRVILLRRGVIEEIGAPREVIAAYERGAARFRSSPASARMTGAELPRLATVTGLAFLDGNGREVSALGTGDPCSIRVDYSARERVVGTAIEVFFFSIGGELLCQLTSDRGGARITLERGGGTVEFFCPQLPLLPGLYHIDTSIEQNDWQHRCALLRVNEGRGPGTVVRGEFFMPHELSRAPAEDQHPVSSGRGAAPPGLRRPAD